MSRRTAHTGTDDSNDLREDEVRSAVACVLKTSGFVQAPRMAQFLNFIIEETLANRGHRITGYAIGVEVYGRGADFDATTDSVVRVEARRLRRTLTEYYAGHGAADSLIIELPKGSYAPSFKRRPPCSAPLNESPPGPQVRVQTLATLSNDPQDVFLARGLTEQIVTALGRFPDIVVYAADQQDEVPAMASLSVGFVLGGSLQHMHDRLRVTMHLSETKTGAQVWSEKFDRTFSGEDLFDLEDDIATRLAARLADRHSPLRRLSGGSPKTARTEAYTAVLMHQAYLVHHNPRAHAQCRTALEAAVAVDSGYADAWAALSGVYLDEYRLGINPRPGKPEPLERARNAALTATTLAPDSAASHHALACVCFHTGEIEDFHIAAERSLSLNPGSADALADIGIYLCLLGDENRGLALVNRALELNPLHPGWYRSARILSAIMVADYEHALYELKRGWIEGYLWTHVLAAAVFAALDRLDEAERQVAAALAVRPDLTVTFPSELAKWRPPDMLVKSLLKQLARAGFAPIIPRATKKPIA